MIGDAKRKVWPVGLLAVTGAVALVAGHGSLAYADTSPGTTTVNVQVSSAILMTGLTPSFTLAGDPGDVAVSIAPVTMTITTNNAAGYTVLVEPGVAELVGAIPGNTATIATSLLEVKETAAGTYENLGINAPVTLFTKDSASAGAGDLVSSTFRMTIPFVQPDTYTGTVNFIATTL